MSCLQANLVRQPEQQLGLVQMWPALAPFAPPRWLWAGRWGRGRISEALALVKQNGNSRVDGYIGCSFRYQQFANDPLIDRFEFHCGFVRLNFSQNIARADLITFGNQPFGQGAFFHGG